MRETKTILALRARRVYNSYGFFQGLPYICYHAPADHRDWTCAGWRVVKQGVKLSDTWSDYGAKVFLTRQGPGSPHERRMDALREAQKWAQQEFGILEWAKDPFGSYGDAPFVKARLAYLLSPEQGRK